MIKTGRKVLISIIGMSLMFFVIYRVAYTSTFKGEVLQTPPQIVQTQPVSTDATVTFTIEALSKYNGMNGQAAYVAIDNIVYDMSHLASWENGVHQGLKAGRDLTLEFSQSPHFKSIMDQAIVVGVLLQSDTKVVEVEEPEMTTPIISISSDPMAIKSWQLDTLAEYNGKNNKPAYIAVEGIVYDVSQLGSWENGSHQGISAGQDVTEVFLSSPHSKAILDQAIIVGKLDDIVVEKVRNSIETITSKAVASTKIWTSEELTKFNGVNSPAYLAVEGIVYDVSHLGSWENGTHKGIQAGQDVSEAFRSSPHSQAILGQAVMVGRLEDSVVETIADKVKTQTTEVNTTNNWTLEELSTYNGINKPAYLAVDGIVYDVSHLGTWEGGSHKGIKAGQDVTLAFNASPHSRSILNQAIVIGTLDVSNLVMNTNPTLTSNSSWTLEELSKYNGINGNQAFIAVSGSIYDVSNIGAWSNGTHKGIRAGTDVTEAFSSSPHLNSLLNQLRVVGQLGEPIDMNKVNESSMNTSFNLDYDDDDDEDEDDEDDDEDDDDDDDENDDDEDDEDEDDD